MAEHASTTRRALLTAPAVALVATPLAAVASPASRVPQRWRETIRAWEFFKKNGGLTALRAYEYGCDLDDLECLTLSGPKNTLGGYPIAFFRTDDGHLSVHPYRVMKYTRIDRGDGPALSDLTPQDWRPARPFREAGL